jgi:hypothetical protein
MAFWTKSDLDLAADTAKAIATVRAAFGELIGAVDVLKKA